MKRKKKKKRNPKTTFGQDADTVAAQRGQASNGFDEEEINCGRGGRRPRPSMSRGGLEGNLGRQMCIGAKKRDM